MTDKTMDCGSVAHGDEMECPGCGRVLPETTGQEWSVTDGDPLGCGCDGCWSADGEDAHPMHDDRCLQCAQDEIDDLRAQLTKAMESGSVAVGSPAHVAVWDAISAYAQACGGHVGGGHGATGRQAAVVAVESALAGVVGTGNTECRSVDVKEAIRQLDMAAAVCRESAVLCLINDALRVLGVNFDDTDCGSVDGKDDKR